MLSSYVCLFIYLTRCDFFTKYFLEEMRTHLNFCFLCVSFMICRRDIVCFSLCRVIRIYTLTFSVVTFLLDFQYFSARKFTKEQFQTGKMLCVFIQVLFVYIYDIFLRILLFRSIRLAIEFNWVECVTKFYNSRTITLDCSIKLNAQNFKVR